jgi:hypothetical protein
MRREVLMTLRDMTPEELELFEEDITPKPDEIDIERETPPSEMGRVREPEREEEGPPDPPTFS